MIAAVTLLLLVVMPTVTAYFTFDAPRNPGLHGSGTAVGLVAFYLVCIGGPLSLLSAIA